MTSGSGDCVLTSGSGAERIVMAARVLHGTCAGKEARARNNAFFRRGGRGWR